jgi:peroxiredoxin
MVSILQPPAIFLIDRDGTVRFVHVDEDYKTRPSAKQMLAVADRTFGAS